MKKAGYIMLGCIGIMLLAAPVCAMGGENVIVKYENGFEDIKVSDECYDAVKYVSDKNIMQGISEHIFGVDEAMTRGDFVVCLYALANKPKVDDQVTFQDVSQKSECAVAIEWGVENKIISGYSETLFKPDHPITREEMIKILYNYTQSIGKETPIEGMSIREYVDEQHVSKWARESMRWGLNVGYIVVGIEEEKLMPQEAVTRGEGAITLTAYCNHVLN